MRLTSHAVALLLLTPFAALVVFGIIGPGAVNADFIPGALRGLASSILYGAVAAIFSVGIGALLAHRVCFGAILGRRLVSRLLVLPLLLPPFAVATLYREQLSPLGIDLTNGVGFVCCAVVTLYPYTYLLLRVAFSHQGAAYLELGSATGIDSRRALRRILLPLALPAALLGGGLVLFETTSDFGAASALAVDGGTIALNELWLGRDQPLLAARLSLLFIVAALVATVLISRAVTPERFRQLILPPATPASPPRSTSWGRGATASLLCLVPWVLGFFLPCGMLVVSFFAAHETVDLGGLFAGCASTIGLIAAVVLVCVTCAAVLFTADHDSPTVLGRFTLRWLSLSYLMPATTVAFAVLITARFGLPFLERFGDFTAFLFLVFALSLRFVGFLIIPIAVGLAAAPRRLGDLASSVGLSPRRAFLRLYLPHARPFVLLGVLLIIIQVLREVTLTVMLHPFAFEPIATRAFSWLRLDLVQEASAWLLVLILLGLYPVMTLESLLTRRGSDGG